MDYKAKAIELLGEKKEDEFNLMNEYCHHCGKYAGDKIIGSNQMHSKAMEVVVGLLEERKMLLEALKRLVERIDFNGGIGEYKGGPAFVMKAARKAIAKAEETK